MLSDVEKTQRLLEAVLEAMPVGVIIADPNGKLIGSNPANERIWGEPPPTADFNEYRQWVGYWPETGVRLEPHEWVMSRALNSGEVCAGELVEIERFDDRTRRFILNSGAPVRDADGSIVAGLVAQLDVTERVLAERALSEALAAKEILLQEVNHRVKNSLQVVTSLLTLQARQVKDPEVVRVLDEARARISVVAGLHQRLYSTSEHDRVDFASYVRELAARTVSAFGGDGRVRLELGGLQDGVVLLLNQAVPLALVVSEMLTNAVKYAFVGRDDGVIRLEVTKDEGAICILVADDGCGLPAGFDPAKSTGLGMRIITLLTRQARGQLEILDQKPGAVFRITLREA